MNHSIASTGLRMFGRSVIFCTSADGIDVSSNPGRSAAASQAVKFWEGRVLHWIRLILWTVSSVDSFRPGELGAH